MAESGTNFQVLISDQPATIIRTICNITRKRCSGVWTDMSSALFNRHVAALLIVLLSIASALTSTHVAKRHSQLGSTALTTLLTGRRQQIVARFHSRDGSDVNGKYDCNNNNIFDKVKSTFSSASIKKAAVSFALSTSILSSTIGTNPLPSFAADTVAVGKCLLQSCQKELAECILNPKCFANVICLNSCNGRSDEATCQIKCGDLFENDVVGKFNSCAVSQKKCVPQKQNEGEYPVPPISSQVRSFDTSIWNGRWYISAGLNKIFDIFDCQVHFFTSPSPGKFYAKLFWRVTEPDGEYFTKDAVQRFVQDPKNPAHLINHDNEYLHYKDDWYVLDYEPDEFVLVYYMGSNDAWDGYGGAFLYTREPTVNPKLVPRLEKAVASMNMKYKWSDFVQTDNSCNQLAESPTVLREKFAKRIILTEEAQLQSQLTGLRNAAVNTVVNEEKDLEKSVITLEKELEKFLKETEGVIEKDLEGVEKAIGIK